MVYNDFKALFYSICEIKQFVVQLNREDLKVYKRIFYSQKFPSWRLDLLWEFIWDDKSYEEIEKIFQNKKLI